jgi:hypothetical protein
MRPRLTTPDGAGPVLREFLALQVAMVIGALGCLLLGIQLRASSTYAAIYHPGTVLYFVGDIFFLTFPVVAWLILRGRGWRHALGMALAMLGPVAAIVLLGELLRYASLRWLVTAMYPAMSMGMLGYLILGVRARRSGQMAGSRRGESGP